MTEPLSGEFPTTGLQSHKLIHPLMRPYPLDEVTEALAKLQGGKASDVCNTSSELLRAGGPAMIHELHAVLICHLTICYNSSLQKKGLVFPV